jgi:hypothetical protein
MLRKWLVPTSLETGSAAVCKFAGVAKIDGVTVAEANFTAMIADPPKAAWSNGAVGHLDLDHVIVGVRIGLHDNAPKMAGSDQPGNPLAHPAWTGGRGSLLDTGGQVARFNKRFGGGLTLRKYFEHGAVGHLDLDHVIVGVRIGLHDNAPKMAGSDQPKAAWSNASPMGGAFPHFD